VRYQISSIYLATKRYYNSLLRILVFIIGNIFRYTDILHIGRYRNERRIKNCANYIIIMKKRRRM